MRTRQRYAVCVIVRMFFFFNDTATTEIYTPFPTRRSSDLLFTLNLHGFRANQEILERSGSGYVGKHGDDCLFFGDSWFRGIELGYGPDGGVMVLDWSDTGECHENTGVHRTSGRIYKITFGKPKLPALRDLSKL